MSMGGKFSVLRDYHFGVGGIMFVWVMEKLLFLSCEYMFVVGLKFYCKG